MKRVLVTGATGFIGSNLTKKLMEEGYDVRVLLRKNSNTEKIRELRTEKVYGDLLDLSSLNRALKGVELVFNLAAGLPYHKLSEQEYRAINVDGVQNIIGASARKNISRLVHVSTVGVYGETSKLGFSEQAPINSVDAYSKTKALGDNLIFQAIKERGLPATIIRPTIAYGPGDTRPGFSNLFSLIEKGMFIPVGDGKNYFHTVYIENLIDALLLAAKHKSALGRDFIIGDEPCPKMIDIIKTVARVEKAGLPNVNIPLPIAYGLGRAFDLSLKLGLPAPLTTQRVRFISQNRRYITKKANTILGFKPQISLEEGVRRTYLWYRLHGLVS